MGKEHKCAVQGGGINDRGLAKAAKEPLGGTGGSVGGGTIAGEGEPSGTDTDPPDVEKREDVSERGALFEAEDELAGRTQSEEAAEAAALGPSPGSVANHAAATRRREGAPPAGGGIIGDVLGSSRGLRVGSGTPPDKGGLGGGEPEAEVGTTGPGGTRSPGGEGRR